MSGTLHEDLNAFHIVDSDIRIATRNHGNGFSIYYIVDSKSGYANAPQCYVILPCRFYSSFHQENIDPWTDRTPYSVGTDSNFPVGSTTGP
jgi:hypothetical protein